MRHTWAGSIQLAMLCIPVKLGSAVGDSKLPLHQYRESDASRIRYKKVAEADGQEVPSSEIVRGFETPNGQVVILSDDELASAYGNAVKIASIIMFTSPDRISRLAAGKSYLVQPDKGGEKPYALLAAALLASGKIAVVRFALRSQDALAVLYPTKGGHLVLEQLQWAADVRAFDFPAPDNSASSAEMKIAMDLIAAMSGAFEHTDYLDESQINLNKVVQAKIERGQVTGVVSGPQGNANGGAVLMDMMGALQASLAAQKPVPGPRKRQPAKRKVAS